MEKTVGRIDIEVIEESEKSLLQITLNSEFYENSTVLRFKQP